MPESQVPSSSQSEPTPDANAQAKAALPQPKYMAPGEGVAEETPLGKAYKAGTAWLGTHEKTLSEKYLQPFRQGLDNMAQDLQQAGESGHTKSGGQLNSATRALAEGTSELLKNVPVGKDAKETAFRAATNLPELPEGHIFKDIEGVRPASAKEIIESQGLVYKGEIVPTSKVHMFEHPDHPGKTASLFEHEINPDSVRTKMDSKIKDFETGAKAKAVTKNASGESAASQEAINRAASEKSKGESYFRINSLSKEQVPMSSIDGVDAKPGPYDVIVKRSSNGSTIHDSGTKARPVSQDILDGKKSLPPIGDNFRTDLSKYTDTLHHETSVDRALALIPGGGVSSEVPDLYFSNVPELATGQGKNKGIHIEFDAKGISGQVNRSKPMSDAAYEQGNAEFWAKHNDQKTLQKNVKAITIDKNAEATKGEGMMLRQTQKRLEANGWAKTQTENGIRYERPTKPSAKSVEMTKEVSRAAEDYLTSLGKSKK